MFTGKFTKGTLTVLTLNILGRLPLRCCRWLGHGIGQLSYWFKTKSYRITVANIAYCLPELNAQQQQQLVRNSLVHTATTMIEMAAIWHKPYTWMKQQITSIKGEELLTPTADDQGIIIIAPHIGNWEVLGLYLPSVQHIVSLYQPPKMPELEPLIRAAREKTGGAVAATNRRGVSQILKHLRNGGMTGILPDQIPNDINSGIHAPFFGKPALTMTLITNLIQKTQCRAVCGYAKRVDNGFELVFVPANEAIYSEDIHTSVLGLNLSIEACVRDIPEQYQWEYKRFRKQPKDMKNIYRRPRST